MSPAPEHWFRISRRWRPSLPASRKLRAIWLSVLIIVVCSLLGGVYGPRVRAAAAPSEDDLRESIRNFASVYRVVEENYADRVNPDTVIYNGALPNMLR